jgi:hypothetical protein
MFRILLPRIDVYASMILLFPMYGAQVGKCEVLCAFLLVVRKREKDYTELVIIIILQINILKS